MNLRVVPAVSAALLSFILFASPALAREKPIPKEPDKFTAYMAERFAEAMPDSKVTVKGTLDLKVLVGGRDVQQVRLINVWEFCERDRRNCRKEVDSFLANMPGAMQEGDIPPKPENIRVMVRTAAYIADLRRSTAAKPDTEVVFRPVAGDVWMICVLDMPHGVQPLSKGSLAKLGMTEDEAIALGLKNVAAALRPLAADTHVVKKLGLTFAAGNFYESSRMLLHDSWAEMSRAMGGHLVVTVPESDVIIFGNGGGNGDRLVLSAFTQTILEKAPKPLSASLFEWTEAGWKVVTIQGAGGPPL